MKIGLDGRFWSQESAGLARYSRELVSNLLKIDQENEYFLFLLEKDFDDCQLKAKNLTLVPISSTHYSLAEQIKLPIELTKVKLDFIHFLSFNHPIFYHGDFIVTIHDLTLFFYPSRRGKTFIHQWAMEMVMRNAVSRAKKIIVPSQNTKKDIIKKFKVQSSKIKVTYEGVPNEFKLLSKQEINKFKKQNRLFKPFLFYVGQWRPHKNLVRLIEAFEIVKKESGKDFQLVIGGRPDPAYLEMDWKLKNSLFKKDIICPGFIDDEELPLWYNSASAFIFPSEYEGFGLPPLEAMKCGTPVIASEVSSIPEVLGKAAMYFDPKKSQEIAQNIILFFKNPDLKTTMREKGFVQVNKFSFEKMAKETLKVYNSIKQNSKS